MSTNITTNATNKTPNYGLPIFIGSDKPSWLTDWNGSMTEIDSLLKQIETVGSANSTQIEGLKTSLETANNAITALQEGLSTTTENTTKNTTDIGTLNTSLNGVQDDLIAQNTLVKTLSTTVATLSETVSGLEGTVSELSEYKCVRQIVSLANIPFNNVNFGTFVTYFQLDEKFDLSKPITVSICRNNVIATDAIINGSTTVLGVGADNSKKLSVSEREYSDAISGGITIDESAIFTEIYCATDRAIHFKVVERQNVSITVNESSNNSLSNNITNSGAVGSGGVLSTCSLIFEQ